MSAIFFGVFWGFCDIILLMEMNFINPTLIKLPRGGDDVARFLTYDDKSVGVQISRLKQNIRFKKGDPDAYHERLAALKAEEKVCLLKQNAETGEFWTYAGLAKDLGTRFGWVLPVRPDFDTDKLIAFKKLPLEPRYYQKEAFDALVAVGHGAIQLPTGSGKSLLIQMLMKRYPVKTLVVTPWTTITDQLMANYVEAFGKQYVGMFGDGKKEFKKLFTIATAKSISMLEPGSPEWEALSQCQMVIFDESHMVPAETFQRVCLSVCVNAPLKFFVSATQLRNDGSELLLKGITGPVVYIKSFKELANEGYLKKPTVHIFNVLSCGSSSFDPKKETRQQLYLNPNVNQLAGDIASKMVLSGRQVIILIEEYDQFLMLKNFMNVDFEFLHGPVSSKKNKEVLPKQYWKCDVEKTVKEFNEGKVRCIIGTTAISTGVDLKPVGGLIYLQGGTSPIKIPQGVGRGTRPFGPSDLWAVDFRVQGSTIMERHIGRRLDIYDTLSDKVLTHGWDRNV